MIKAIQKRRSIREYLNKSISDDQLNSILTAAMYSPSANAKYPWDLVVVKDSQLKEKLSKTTPWSAHAKNASVIIVVVGHSDESNDWIEDCSIVAQHIWLETTEQELGSCWIQIRGNESAEKQVKELLNIPDELRVLCLMPIGVPAKELSEHNKDDFDQSKIKQEKY